MIYVRDKGQMCNNILQFAHVYAFARENGRKAISMRFAYKYQWFHICRTRDHSFLRYALAKFAAARHLIPVVSYDTPGEVSTRKEQTILKAKNIVVQGWEVRFYDLFLKYFDEIRNLFAFLPNVEKSVHSLTEPHENRLKIGIHVRRGDYCRWYDGRYFFSDAQYANVARSIRALFPEREITFFVCTNDPELQQDVYRNAVPDSEWVFPTGNPAEDLCLLSHCDYLAGPPSTFSLVASMYRELPLYWIEDAQKEPAKEDFSTFRTLFRKIK